MASFAGNAAASCSRYVPSGALAFVSFEGATATALLPSAAQSPITPASSACAAAGIALAAAKPPAKAAARSRKIAAGNAFVLKSCHGYSPLHFVDGGAAAHFHGLQVGARLNKGVGRGLTHAGGGDGRARNTIDIGTPARRRSWRQSRSSITIRPCCHRAKERTSHPRPRVFAQAHRFPLVESLARRHARVHNGHGIAEAAPRSATPFGSERNFRYEYNGATPQLERMANRTQVHLGFARPVTPSTTHASPAQRSRTHRRTQAPPPGLR